MLGHFNICGLDEVCSYDCANLFLYEAKWVKKYLFQLMILRNSKIGNTNGAFRNTIPMFNKIEMNQ
ncbi:hypothetical protein B4W76_05060 [Staphylococcus intermedius]|nr:hypothetical protein B4W76_05060 [Staphylococcus intermedius]